MQSGYQSTTRGDRTRCAVFQCVRKAVDVRDLAAVCGQATHGAIWQAFQRHTVSMNLDLCPCCPCRPDGTRAEIYLKREDLNHTGAHKINNSLGQVRSGIASCFGVSEQGAVAHMAAVCSVHLSCRGLELIVAGVQVLLCRRIGKQRIIAETGAGQHGVATVICGGS